MFLVIVCFWHFAALYLRVASADRRETFKHDWKCVNFDNVGTSGVSGQVDNGRQLCFPGRRPTDLERSTRRRDISRVVIHLPSAILFTNFFMATNWTALYLTCLC